MVKVPSPRLTPSFSGDLINTTIGPQFWDTFDVLPKDTKIIMNLVCTFLLLCSYRDVHQRQNLDTGIYQEALKVANATMRGLDSGRVIAMESQSYLLREGCWRVN